MHGWCQGSGEVSEPLLNPAKGAWSLLQVALWWECQWRRRAEANGKVASTPEMEKERVLQEDILVKEESERGRRGGK